MVQAMNRVRLHLAGEFVPQRKTTGAFRFALIVCGQVPAHCNACRGFAIEAPCAENCVWFRFLIIDWERYTALHVGYLPATNLAGDDGEPAKKVDPDHG